MPKQNLEEKLSPDEIKIIKKQLVKTTPPKQDHKHHFGGKHVRLGVISDTHIGSKAFDEALMEQARQYMHYEGVDAVYHVGDIIEGMSGRDGHIYELTHLGISAQLDYASQLINYWETPMFAITGNHDDWASAKMNMGVDVGSELEKRCKGFKCLGSMEADINLYKGVKMKLFHPNDGSAYAPGYKLMKLAESFTGGEKPNIVLQGHYHKSLYMFSRNIHLYEAGTLQGQSKFMRGKKLQAHKGFWVLDLRFGPNGVQRVINEFIPKYD